MIWETDEFDITIVKHGRWGDPKTAICSRHVGSMQDVPVTAWVRAQL